MAASSGALGALVAAVLLVGAADAKVWGGGKFDNFDKFGEYIGRPVGGE